MNNKEITIKELTIENIANNIADIEEWFENNREFMEEQKRITSKAELRKRLGKQLINDIFEEVDRTIMERKELEYDFREIMKEIRLASKADPKDKFLKELLNNAKELYK